jgi:Icc-related predicted phosphoesterase
MLLVADVHGAAAALRRVAASGEPLLVLGDLINFIDYRTNQGILTDVAGGAFVEEMVRLRTAGRMQDAAELWAELSEGREAELRGRFDELIQLAYEDVCGALDGAEAYVTYGNVDQPTVLAETLPPGSRFVDGEVVEISGYRVGFAGGGVPRLSTPGEVSDEAMAAKLASLGPVDILCTHVAPAVPALARDVVGGKEKGSAAVLDYLLRVQPPFHYFGDIHQPQAISWRVGETQSRNVGYFRATGKAVRHER